MLDRGWGLAKSLRMKVRCNVVICRKAAQADMATSDVVQFIVDGSQDRQNGIHAISQLIERLARIDNSLR